MSAQSSVYVHDNLNLTIRTFDAAVATNHTFDPDGNDSKGVARWADRSGGITVGNPVSSLSVRKPTSGSKMYKVTFKLALPTLEQTSPSTGTGIQPAPTKAYDNQVVVEFMLPERGTTAERSKLFSLLSSWLMTTVNASDDVPTQNTGSPLFNAVTKLEPVW